MTRARTSALLVGVQKLQYPVHGVEGSEGGRPDQDLHLREAAGPEGPDPIRDLDAEPRSGTPSSFSDPVTAVGSTTMPADRPIVAGSRSISTHAATIASSRGRTRRCGFAPGRTSSRCRRVEPRREASSGRLDHDRDLARPRSDRSLLQVASSMEGPLEVRMSAPEQGDDDLDRLLEPTDDVVLRKAEGMSLAAGVARPKAEDEPPTAHFVECLDGLCRDAGIAMEGGHDPGADLDARCGAATAPAMATHSQNPCGGLPGSRHSSSSATQTVSNPACSAPSARSRSAVQRRAGPSEKTSPVGSTRPISSDRMQRLPADAQSLGFYRRSGPTCWSRRSFGPATSLAARSRDAR